MSPYVDLGTSRRDGAIVGVRDLGVLQDHGHTMDLGPDPFDPTSPGARLWVFDLMTGPKLDFRFQASGRDPFDIPIDSRGVGRPVYLGDLSGYSLRFIRQSDDQSVGPQVLALGPWSGADALPEVLIFYREEPGLTATAPFFAYTAQHQPASATHASLRIANGISGTGTEGGWFRVVPSESMTWESARYGSTSLAVPVPRTGGTLEVDEDKDGSPERTYALPVISHDEYTAVVNSDRAWLIDNLVPELIDLEL